MARSTVMLCIMVDSAHPCPLPSPSRAQAAFDEGVRCQDAGQWAAAEAAFEQALRHQPDLAAAWNNLGLLAEARGDAAAACAAYEQALALDASLYAAWLNLATLLSTQMRFEEAEQAFRRAVQLEPEAPAAWSNLGAMLTCMRRDDDALACLQHALSIDPAHAKARFNLGYLWLRQGRLREGWLCNECREGPARIQAALGLPRWMGEPLDGRALLIVTDAAHGDLIQMVRYLGALKAGGAGRLGVIGPPALATLMRRLPELDLFVPMGESLDASAWDAWAPLMSLPYLCATTLETIPASLPYLWPDPVRVAARAWPAPALRVGLVWRGNPLHENDGQRSLPGLHSLAPLWRVPGVAFVSLQSGAGSEEALSPPAGQPLLPLSEPLGDFAETAAVVANLDLVIGVDTSLVHLAGALAKPVWVLLCDHKTDWRWMDVRTDSPWYPGVMRLFRQDASRSWAPVIERVAQALGEWAASASPAALPGTAP